MKSNSILKAIALLSVLTITSSVTIPTIKANASIIEETKIEYSAEDVQKIKEILANQGINEDTQEKLINKKLNGELWDVENPEKLQQVPESFYILNFNNPFEKKTYTFEDGSVLELSHSQTLPSSRKVISNAYSTVWQEEAVKATYGLMRATIYVNCEWTRSIGPKIRNFTDSNIYTFNVGGSVSTTNMNINSSTSAVGKISVYNSLYWGKQADFRAVFEVLGSHGTVSFKLVKM